MPEPRVADPPDDAGRPVPLRVAPDGTSSRDGATDGRDAAGGTVPHGVDETLRDRQAAEGDEREHRSADATGAGEPAGSTRESGYSTERTQGAAQPGTSPDPG